MTFDTIHLRPVTWDSPEGLAARRLRFEVFVDEQGVPPHEEIDAIDPTAWHVLAWDAAGVPAATGRLYFAPDDAPQSPLPAGTRVGRIGRMAVRRAARGRGFGRAVLHALMAEGLRRDCPAFILDAQTHAIGFYAGSGFRVCGPEHLDCGIPHRMMRVEADAARRALQQE